MKIRDILEQSRREYQRDFVLKQVAGNNSSPFRVECTLIRGAFVILKTSLLCCVVCLAQAADPALTLDNQRFAVIRETIPIVLKQGVNQIQFTGVTAQREPDSVMLRDPSGNRVLQILEQNYRADPVSVDALMVLYEGKTIEFQVRNGDRVETVQGKIIRAGTTPRPGMQYVPQYAQQPQIFSQPIVEIDGKLRFDLPGMPVFPALSGDTVLKPLSTGRSGEAGRTYGCRTRLCLRRVELVIGLQPRPGMGQSLDLIGWVTIENRSGKTFENARIKLMAGDVNKLQPARICTRVPDGGVAGGLIAGIRGPADYGEALRRVPPLHASSAR